MPARPASRVSMIALSFFLSTGYGTRLFSQQTPFFTPGNLVVAVEGCGVRGGSCASVPSGTGTNGGYGDNQAAPFTLFQYTPAGTSSVSYVNSLVMPQTASGANLPFSGEYGSSSEGTIQLSGTGQYLTLMGYGIDAPTFDANPTQYGAAPSNALAQSGSLTGQSYTPVARVVSLIDPYGNVNTSTALYNIFNTNNPRSAYTIDGLNSVYVSGQGSGSDATGGVFLTPLGATNSSPTAITGLDTTSNTLSQDTRNVQIYNNTLYVSVDSRSGTGSNRSFVGTLGTPPSTGLYKTNAGPTQLTTSNNAATPVAVTSTGKLVLTASETNGINSTGQTINLSPSAYFFANAYTLYVADTGSPKQTSASTLLGDGGLQKWINTKTDGTGTWKLAYTLAAGLNLVQNSASNANNISGSTGLYSLTGTISGSNVYLYATNYNIADLDPTYLYGITDSLAATTSAGQTFTQLAAAPTNSNFKGVSFTPTLPAGSATITSTPSGLTFTAAGSGCTPGTYTTPVTLAWTPGSNCTLSVASTQTSAGTQYLFANWQDGTTATSDSVTAPVTSAVYSATFAPAPAPVGNLEEAVDATTSSTTVSASDSLFVSGWTADAVDGAPVGNVKVYVDGTLAGSPTVGISRPDVASYTGKSSYTNSGYHYVTPASTFTGGAHALTVVSIDTGGRSTTFGPLSFTVVAGPPVGNLEQAIDSTTSSTSVSQSDSLFVSGWTADPTDGSPVSNVKVNIDGALAGTPTLGGSRPDVASYYKNSAYANSGYQLTYAAANLSIGSHAVTVVSIDSAGRSTTFGPLSITVTAPTTPPFGNLEQAVDNATGSSTVLQADSLFVSGWVADQADGAPLSNVKVYIDGNPSGTPTLGVSRPDVASYYNNAAYTNSGYQFSTPASTIPVGPHSATIVAIDSAGRSTTFGPLTFTIQ